VEITGTNDDWWIDMTRVLGMNGRKGMAAAIGAGALVTMGIIGAAAGAQPDGQTAVVSGGSMSTGETTTMSYTGTVAPIVAVPVVKASPFGEG
jgi:hypothetical protein